MTPPKGSLKLVVDRAAVALERAREMVEADLGPIPIALGLVAVAEQLAVANALTIVQMARDAGET